MKTLVNAGNRINYSNSGSAIASGDVVVLRSGASGVIGIAVTDIPATTGTGELCVGGYPEGNHTLAKHSGEAFAIGDILYWNSSSAYLTKTASGNTRAGWCSEAAGSAATSAKFKLNA